LSRSGDSAGTPGPSDTRRPSRQSAGQLKLRPDARHMTMPALPVREPQLAGFPGGARLSASTGQASSWSDRPKSARSRCGSSRLRGCQRLASCTSDPGRTDMPSRSCLLRHKTAECSVLRGVRTNVLFCRGQSIRRDRCGLAGNVRHAADGVVGCRQRRTTVVAVIRHAPGGTVIGLGEGVAVGEAYPDRFCLVRG
jgi:hypothetical protein